MATLDEEYMQAVNRDTDGMVPQPVMTGKDVLFGWYDGSWANKQRDYISKVNELQYNEHALDRTIAAMKRNGINPYYLFKDGGGMSGMSSMYPDSTPGYENSGKSALGSFLGFTVAALITALTKKPGVTNISKTFIKK